MLRNDFYEVQIISFIEGVHHDDSTRREVHVQAATGDCECSDRLNKGTAIAASSPFIVFEIGTSPTASSYFEVSGEELSGKTSMLGMIDSST